MVSSWRMPPQFTQDCCLLPSVPTAGSTVVIVSQRASSVMHASKIIVLEDGEAIGIGTHGELLRDCPIYREIYETQFGEGDGNG